jgi:integrase
MRPEEMLNLKKEDILIDQGFMFIRNPKEKSRKKLKLIFLNDDDIDILRQMPQGLSNLYFFRHPSGIKGCQLGQRFGEKYLYKKFKKACDNLAIEGLDLYGATRPLTLSI